MSKKSRSRQAARRQKAAMRAFPWTWVVVAAVGAVALAAVAFLALRGGLGDESNGTPQVTPQLSGAPRLEVAQDFVDEGYVKFDVPVRTTFELTNVGDQPLQILGTPQVQLVEGC